MGDCARNCKRREEIAAVGISQASFSKKMKIQIDFFHELNLPSRDEIHLQDHRFSALSPDNIISPLTSSNSGGFLSGDISFADSIACIESSLLSKDSLRVVDLEAKSFETESSTCIDNKFSRETTSSSDFYGDSNEMDSLAGVKSCRKKSQATKIPNQEEIDQFFSEADKKEQKRFADKYNYDVVKDVPLEGRYQWVSLKP